MNRDVAFLHEQSVLRIRSLAVTITPREVAHSFVSSLGSRQLERRSALASFAIARVFPEHELEQRKGTYATICGICGWSKMPRAEEEEPISNLLLERKKYGGVRHDHPDYIELDLTEFSKLPSAFPTDSDWQCLRRILCTPSKLEESAKAADLERAMQGSFRSNKNERTVLIQILSHAGILEPEGHPSYFDNFVPQDDRVLPTQRFCDWGYPTIWWRAKHGIRRDALSFWFPELKQEQDYAEQVLAADTRKPSRG